MVLTLHMLPLRSRIFLSFSIFFVCSFVLFGYSGGVFECVWEHYYHVYSERYLS